MKSVLFILLLCPAFLRAQYVKISPEDTQRRQSYLLLRDGSMVRGQILRQDSTIISVRKRGGQMSFIEADQVVRISADRPMLPPNTVEARAIAPYKVFVFRDGSQVEGTFVKRDSTMITVRKRNGQLTYFEPELLLRTDSVLVDTVEPQSVVSNQFSPFLLSGITAFNPEKGRAYFRSAFILLSEEGYSIAQLPTELNYGLTRHISIGASVNPFRVNSKYIGGFDDNPLRASVRFFGKLSLPIGSQFRIGANVAYQVSQQLNILPIAGQWTIQAIGTFGDVQRNVSLGYGKHFFQSPYSTNSSFITVGVVHKIGNNLAFVSDNTFNLNAYASGIAAYVSTGLRISRQHHAFDLGLLASITPRYIYGIGQQPDFKTKAYFSPHIGYNLLIGRN